MIRILAFIMLIITCRASSMLMRNIDECDSLMITLNGITIALGIWTVDYLARHAR